jgi:hypothetical protein
MQLLFINSHSTSAWTSAWSDHRNEPVGQIRAPALEPVRVEWSTSNTTPSQEEHIQTQSVGHDYPKWNNTTSSSPTCMCIQFRTLTFHSRPEEQLQEWTSLKKSVNSLRVVIRALCSPLGPIQEQLQEWTSLKKSVNSLRVVIRALCSPLGPIQKVI